MPWAILALVAFGVFAMSKAANQATVDKLKAYGRTGYAGVDRLLPIAARHVADVFGDDVRAMRAVMTIIKKESAGNPANYKHDLTAKGGPGVGPMAVNRLTAQALGLWVPRSKDVEAQRAEYLALWDNEDKGIAWGVRVFDDKLRRANGDYALALERYNGSGPNAVAYREDALRFISNTWKGSV